VKRQPKKKGIPCRDVAHPADAGAKWRQYLRAIGPGLITGASDDDPSGIATYAQAGSKFGLSFLWTALLTFPLITANQEICDRTALATGMGLGELASSVSSGREDGSLV
jgi:Mn2+/Fe2+ NRAMP family transporter